jgi:hypothetical protein
MMLENIAKSPEKTRGIRRLVDYIADGIFPRPCISCENERDWKTIISAPIVYKAFVPLSVHFTISVVTKVKWIILIKNLFADCAGINHTGFNRRDHLAMMRPR